jgi:hypothetical protein
MPAFTIPNESAAGFADQAEPDQRDIEILTAGLSHGTGSAGSYGVGPTGVETGCAVTAQGSPDMTVAVAAGNVRIGGRFTKVAAGNVTITTADGANPRFDLIVVDTAGAKTAIAGTAAANAVFPTITSGKVVLAAVYVPASDTTIGSNQITDKRMMIDQPPFENVKWYGALGNDSANDQASIQAAHDAAYDVGQSYGRTRTVFFPSGIYRVGSTVTMNQGVRFEGAATPPFDSRYGVWLTATASSMSILTVPDDSVLRQTGISLSNIGFTVLTALTNTTGVSISNMNRWRIDNCSFQGSDATNQLTTGLYLRLGAAVGMDNNWSVVTRCEFKYVFTCIDAADITGLSVLSTHFQPSGAGCKGIFAQAILANSGCTTGVRVFDSEFGIPSDSIGFHTQGTLGSVVGCRFEGSTSSTGNTAIKVEKVAGSPSNAGRRNQFIGCMVNKTVTGIEITTNTQDTTILGCDFESTTTNLLDNGTRTTYISTTNGEIARLSVAVDLPAVTAPANPASGFHRFFVDTADSTFKSKSSAGVISVYGARPRSLFIDASMLRLDAAQGVKIGTPPNAVDAVSLADGVTSGAYCNFNMPVDVITGAVTIRPQWAPGATDGTAHTVRWQRNIKILTAADVTAAGESTAWTGASAARTVNVEVLEPGAATTITPAADDRIRLEIQRLGGDGADTYLGAVQLLGIRIDYQANN